MQLAEEEYNKNYGLNEERVKKMKNKKVKKYFKFFLIFLFLCHEQKGMDNLVVSIPFWKLNLSN